MTTDSNDNKTTPGSHPSTVGDNLAPEKHIPEDAICMVKFNQTDSTEGADAMAIIEIQYGADGHMIDPFADTGLETEPVAKTKKPANKRERKGVISLKQFYALIPNEEAAITFMENRRWGKGLYCPKCGLENSYRVKSGKPMPFRCRSCKKYFSVKVGTVMEQSNLPIGDWLLAIHIMHTSRKGTSALQMQKMLGVDYRTSWFLCHRIREGMRTEEPMMVGVVEVDETYIGGKMKSMHKAKKTGDPMFNKFAVIGFKDDKGNVIAFPMADTTTMMMTRYVMENVAPESTVYTDSHPGYSKLAMLAYDHKWINHSVGQFVDGMVTTNGIESFWALLKRGYVGTFHYMSAKHLHRYCTEFSARHNAGPGNGFQVIGALASNMEGKRLSYMMLTGKRIKGGRAKK